MDTWMQYDNTVIIILNSLIYHIFLFLDCFLLHYGSLGYLSNSSCVNFIHTFDHRDDIHIEHPHQALNSVFYYKHIVSYTCAIFRYIHWFIHIPNTYPHILRILCTSHYRFTILSLDAVILCRFLSIMWQLQCSRFLWSAVSMLFYLTMLLVLRHNVSPIWTISHRTVSVILQ